MPLSPGSRLDAYELLRPLGSGGMGDVWLARELRLERNVALKLLPAGLPRDPGRVSRFEQEARAASALNHPNVCTIRALGETAGGQHYIAMEFVQGETLRTRLGSTRLSIRELLDIAIQIASALSTAHAAGIVHRDIKPENVMLRPDGLVKVLDFGLAKLSADVEIASLDMTRPNLHAAAGSVVGTVAAVGCALPGLLHECGGSHPRPRVLGADGLARSGQILYVTRGDPGRDLMLVDGFRC